MYAELSRVVAFANGKGGVGKTSSATACAGLAAAAGWKTLLIDTDPQGNCEDNLGYAAESDGGEHLSNVLVHGVALEPVLRDVRPNLDVVCGGAELKGVELQLLGKYMQNQGSPAVLADALAGIAPDYDVVFLDTPPYAPTILHLDLVASRWAVIPTKPDESSIKGLGNLAGEIVNARNLNPYLEVLGSVLFGVEKSATAIRRSAGAKIANALGTAAPLFDSVVRHTTATAVTARDKGMLPHELAETVDNAEPFWKALQEGRTPTQVPGTAPALAEDYLLLCQEILQRIDQREQEEDRVAVGADVEGANQ
jgi:cellulose biosynthesis protein BcsQ